MFFAKNTKLEAFKKELFNQFQTFETELLSKTSDVLEEGHINMAISKLKSNVVASIKINKQYVIKQLPEIAEIPQFVLFYIANNSGNEADSGKYHMYRGVFSPLKEGQAFVRIFNLAVDKLVEMNVHSEEEGQEQKRQLLASIRESG